MTSPTFWTEADIIMSDSATLSIHQSERMAECLLRDAITGRTDRMSSEALDVLNALIPAIREAKANKANLKMESAA